MQRLVTICLSLSSFWLFSACASYTSHLQPLNTTSDCIQKLKPTFTADWYNASVDVMGHHISGLLLFKTMPDSSLRIVFTNEVGVTFFDFEFATDGKFTAKQAVNKFGNKAVITTLRKDFELMLLHRTGTSLQCFTSGNEIWYASPAKKETDYFITDKDCTSLLRAEKVSKRKKKVEMRMTGARHLAPDSVHLQHYTFNMQISLKKLNR